MQQDEMFHEDLAAALTHLVSALGGPKAVGVELWPSLTADTAGRKVAHCLNADHAQQFHPQEVLWLLTQARTRGIHSGMAYICRCAGYADPQPVEPEDEAAALQREYIAAAKSMESIAKRLERLALPVRAVRGDRSA
jgi:hypothetical protein